MCDDSQVKITYLKDTVKAFEAKTLQLQETVTFLKGEISTSNVLHQNICKDDQVIMFCTRFPSFVHLHTVLL